MLRKAGKEENIDQTNVFTPVSLSHSRNKILMKEADPWTLKDIAKPIFCKNLFLLRSAQDKIWSFYFLTGIWGWRHCEQLWGWCLGKWESQLQHFSCPPRRRRLVGALIYEGVSWAVPQRSFLVKNDRMVGIVVFVLGLSKCSHCFAVVSHCPIK